MPAKGGCIGLAMVMAGAVFMIVNLFHDPEPIRRRHLANVLSHRQVLPNSMSQSYAAGRHPHSPDGFYEIDPEQVVHAKAFGLAEYNSRVFPFYYRAKPARFDSQDLTLTVFVTENRFERLTDLAKTYFGPISVVLHVPPGEPESIRSTLAALERTYFSAAAFRERVDVHLVSSDFARQLNAWRNLARAYARTEYVMMLDIDLAIRTDLRQGFKQVLESDDEAGRALRNGSGALVVPAFEYVDAKLEPEDWLQFPSTKEQLTKMYNDNTIQYFYQILSVRGQAGTNHEKYFSRTIAPDEKTTYLVDSWKLGYEPYLIFRRDGPPWCDEIFIGFGHNKEACAGEMLLSGMRFHVMREHFITHRSHVKDGKQSKYFELVRNNQIWEAWTESSCMRYIDLLAGKGRLHTAQQSLFDACDKHKINKLKEYIDMSKASLMLSSVPSR